jgi:hypothetical protein
MLRIIKRDEKIMNYKFERLLGIIALVLIVVSATLSPIVLIIVSIMLLVLYSALEHQKK